MSLKTNTEMQIHGADGVHATLLENGDLALYWGEAKMYESLSSAMSSCLDSLKPYLEGGAQEQDLFLVRHYADAGDQELTVRLLEFFNDSSPLSAHVEMRGACLVGFTHDNYPTLPKEFEAVKSTLDELVTTWSASMSTRVKNRNLEAFEIEVFFVPVPSVEEFRKAIKHAIGIPIA
jgi:hypothetical protein